MGEMGTTARELRDMLRSGQVSAREAAEHYLRRIDERADLGAFIAVTADRALEEADAADRLRAATVGSGSGGSGSVGPGSGGSGSGGSGSLGIAGSPTVPGDSRPVNAHAAGTASSAGSGSRTNSSARSAGGPGTVSALRALPPLHGMPLAHKDLVDVAGAPTTRGTAALAARIADDDSPGVAVLRAGGAISLGKTQVPELGLNCYSENLIAPPARNPLDAGLTPGGSSGGSAAAVVTGMLPFAPGSDGGGSVRIPALATGLVGLKPGLGAIPSDTINGLVDDFGAPRLVVSGPLARTAADAAMLYDAMRGASLPAAANGDPEPTVTAVDRADDLTGLRIGFSSASPFEAAHPTPLSPEAVRAWQTAMLRLIDRGHSVEAAEIAYDPRYPEVFASCWMASLSLLPLPDGGEDLLVPFTREFRARALATPRTAHEAAAAQLTEIAADLRAQWGRYDVVLTPGLAFAPPRIGAFLALSPDADYRLQCEWTPFTSMVNVAGLPAVAVPITTLPSGLSMGVQLIGHRGSEAQLLQLAEQLMHP